MIAVTQNQALEYVRQIEAKWIASWSIPGEAKSEGGMDPTVIISVERHHDYEATGALCVLTNNNNWDVWIESDGSVYGEC